jgi:hypothetical protein
MEYLVFLYGAADTSARKLLFTAPGGFWKNLEGNQEKVSVQMDFTFFTLL